MYKIESNQTNVTDMKNVPLGSHFGICKIDRVSVLNFDINVGHRKVLDASFFCGWLVGALSISV